MKKAGVSKWKVYLRRLVEMSIGSHRHIANYAMQLPTSKLITLCDRPSIFLIQLVRTPALIALAFVGSD